MQNRILHLDGAKDAMAALCDGFFADLNWVASCAETAPEDIPEPARRLLVHNSHMTATLQAHYDQPIELQVLEYRRADDQYRRKILLTIDRGEKVVEFGVIRLDLRFTPPEVQSAILERNQPLGDIFGQHRVLTEVQPMWYLRLPSESPPVRLFHPAVAGDAFGRIGVIHCNGRPALELLEVVRADAE